MAPLSVQRSCVTYLGLKGHPLVGLQARVDGPTEHHGSHGEDGNDDPFGLNDPLVLVGSHIGRQVLGFLSLSPSRGIRDQVVVRGRFLHHGIIFQIASFHVVAVFFMVAIIKRSNHCFKVGNTVCNSGH